jgi:hypothetical protein
MTPKNELPKSTVAGIYITSKLEKAGKNGPYYMFESSVGTLVCFDEKLGAPLDKSNEVCYTMLLQDPSPGFKYKQIKSITGSENRARPIPPPVDSPIARSRPSYGGDSGKSYVGPDKTAVFEEKDFRISKLSIFSSIVNLMSAKAKADPEFAKREITDMVLDAVAYSNTVTKEFIYGMPKAEAMEAPPPQIPVAQAPVSSTPQTPVAPTTYTAAPVAQAPAAQTPAPAPAPAPAPKPQPAPAPVYTPPATPPAEVAQAKAAETKALFGGGDADLEKRMADRLKQLTDHARR